jgi:hypothetical protein
MEKKALIKKHVPQTEKDLGRGTEDKAVDQAKRGSQLPEG